MESVIKKMHLDVIHESEFSDYSGHSEGQEIAASESAEITKNIAIKFISWMGDNYVSISAKRRDSEQFYYRGNEISGEGLYNEFLKTL